MTTDGFFFSLFFFLFFSLFFFAQKQYIYSSVLQHKYIRKELVCIIVFWAPKKKEINQEDGMEAERTDFLHLLHALTLY